MLGAVIVLAGILVAEMLGPPAALESAEATAEKELESRSWRVPAKPMRHRGAENSAQNSGFGFSPGR